jgi:uncharacterized protein (DUF885 family)
MVISCIASELSSPPAPALGQTQAPMRQTAPPVEPPAVETQAETVLDRLLADDLRQLYAENPIWASTRGQRRYDDRVPDVGAEARTKQLALWRARREALRRVDRTVLPPQRRLDYDLLAYELDLRLAGARFNEWQMPITQMWGPQTSLPQTPERLTFATREHYADYVTRLERVPDYLAQVEANMREGMAADRTPPRIVMGGAAMQALAQGTERFADQPETHRLYTPFLDANAPADLAERARRVIARDVAPAFQRLGVFLRDEYIPACRETTAASDLPDGAAYYDHTIRDQTTLDLSARQIHDTGLAEVARIRAEMMDVIRRSDFMEREEAQAIERSRLAPAEQDRRLFAAFVEYLRTDPRFYHDSAEELLDGYRAIAKRIDAYMPAMVRTLPRLSYGVREMPPFIARSAPTAYYYPGSIETGVPGYFVANTYRLDQRPKYEMIALTLHEAAPGHHTQNAIANELEQAGLHPWRSTLRYTAFGEGWALYAERLGLEMGPPPYGLYADAYDDFGRLSYEMWRAMRLVVDTGLHALGWERDRAIAFMLENSALTRTNVEREVDRYISWPGQALAYKLGELRIRALRAEAEAALGDRFERRRFHDALLWSGQLPIPVLETHIRGWIEREQRDAD